MHCFQSGGRRNCLLMRNRMPAVCPPKSKLPCSRLYIFFFSITSADSLPPALGPLRPPQHTNMFPLSLRVRKRWVHPLFWRGIWHKWFKRKKDLHTESSLYLPHTWWISPEVRHHLGIRMMCFIKSFKCGWICVSWMKFWNNKWKDSTLDRRWQKSTPSLSPIHLF